MTSGTDNITGILLAGGKSRRMGQDKRFIELQGVSLIKRALSVLEMVFGEVIVVAAEASRDLQTLGPRVMTDLIPNCATLGGLYTGLAHARHPRIFAVACDMPFLDPKVISALAALDPGADVVMPQLSEGLQPMHAVYSKRCLGLMERMVKAGNLKIQELVQDETLRIKLVPEADLRRWDPRLISFMNVNTPADLELARKLLMPGRAETGSHG